ncbi:MarR family winged helix-turn-helix transcriptional regulator [Streptomyces boninensis]|uniref:MarR family winged helix-turn-helix transcriptional regulator n=1 Tax=Streptomyces boninensis TaxID=2039455 RepID=UPI003B21971D
MTNADPRWLTDPEMRAWMGYRRLRLLLDAQIARDLQHDSGLSAADYDVLTALSAAPGHRRRLTQLADRMLWAKSRLSRHIARMETRGLVARTDVAGDARGSAVTLTETGLHTLEQAAPAHVASVRRHFIDLLTEDELRVFAEITERALARL